MTTDGAPTEPIDETEATEQSPGPSDEDEERLERVGDRIAEAREAADEAAAGMGLSDEERRAAADDADDQHEGEDEGEGEGVQVTPG